jgi:hypothetical protein
MGPRSKAWADAAKRAGKPVPLWTESIQQILLNAMETHRGNAIGFFRAIHQAGVRAHLRMHARGRVGLIFSIRFRGQWEFASASKLAKGFALPNLREWLAIPVSWLGVILSALRQRRSVGKEGVRDLTLVRIFRLLLRKLGRAAVVPDAKLFARVEQLLRFRNLGFRTLPLVLTRLGIDLRLTVGRNDTVRVSFRWRDPRGVWMEIPGITLQRLGVVCSVPPHQAIRWAAWVRQQVAIRGALINVLPLPKAATVTQAAPTVTQAAPAVAEPQVTKVHRPRPESDGGLDR